MKKFSKSINFRFHRIFRYFTELFGISPNYSVFYRIIRYPTEIFSTPTKIYLQRCANWFNFQIPSIIISSRNSSRFRRVNFISRMDAMRNWQFQRLFYFQCWRSDNHNWRKKNLMLRKQRTIWAANTQRNHLIFVHSVGRDAQIYSSKILNNKIKKKITKILKNSIFLFVKMSQKKIFDKIMINRHINLPCRRRAQQWWISRFDCRRRCCSAACS